MIVKELVTKLGFKVDEHAIKRADRGLRSLRNIALGVSAGFTAVGGGLLAIANSVAKTGDDLAKTSARVGLSVQSLQKFSHAANLAGADLEGFNTGVTRFARVISDAKEGLETAKRGFDRLKLDPSKFKTMEEAVYAVSDQFAKMPDGIVKTTAAQELFGRSGAQLINFLNQGSDALKTQGNELEALGALMSDKLAKQSEEYNDTIYRLKTAWLGVKYTIAEELIPVMTSYMKDLLEWIKLNKDLIRQKTKEWLDKFLIVLRGTKDVLVSFGEKLGWVIDKMGGFEKTIKIVGALLATLIGAKVVIAIANIVSAIKILGTIIVAVLGTTVGGVALLVGAIAAAVAGIFLIIEDLVAYFRGEDSIFGVMQDMNRKISAGIRQAMKDTWFWIQLYATQIFNWVTERISALWTKLKELSGYNLVKNVVTKITGDDEARNKLKESMDMADFSMKNIISSGPIPIPAQPLTTNNNDVRIESKVEVNVESGANPDDIARAVDDQITQTFDREMRKTLRASEVGGY